jgi:hypothetical protein
VIAKRKGSPGQTPSEQTEIGRHRAMTWAQRLKRVFQIEIERCWRCGGKPAGTWASDGTILAIRYVIECPSSVSIGPSSLGSKPNNGVLRGLVYRTKVNDLRSGSRSFRIRPARVVPNAL